MTGHRDRTGFGLRAGFALALALSGGAAQGQGLNQPAELPPADFAGQQYVDSRGCLFVRAGTADQVLWVPRVSRVGVPMCDTPGSGAQVEGEATATAAQDTGVEAPAPQESSATGGVFVAVGSFASVENVTKAETQLAELGYGVVRGRLQGGSANLTTVFAGPFPDADAAAQARQTLREGGFPDAIVVGP